MSEGTPEIVIQGITESGETFRPSDWAERLSGMLAVFCRHRHLSYSPFVKPVMSGGIRCVVVDRKLERADPAAFDYLIQFARDNRLRMRDGRSEPRRDGQGPVGRADGVAPDASPAGAGR